MGPQSRYYTAVLGYFGFPGSIELAKRSQAQARPAPSKGCAPPAGAPRRGCKALGQGLLVDSGTWGLVVFGSFGV